MDHLLAIKYKDRAENEAVEMWGKIKYYKFSSGMDSVRVVKQIAAYQLSQYKINGKYMNDEKKRKSHTTDLARTKPKAMEMLKIAEQNSAILNKDRHFNGFAW